jgi:hypothetical protein
MYALDCRSYNGNIGKQRKVNFEISDIVLFGVLTELDNNIGILKVSEIYKGIADSIVVIKFENDIDKNEIYHLWIIYGNIKNNNDTIFINECSYSHSINGIPHPPPPHRKVKKQFENIYQILNELEVLYKNYFLFYEELEILRIMSSKKMD